MSSLTPTASELANLSEAANKLWSLDSNRLTYGTDYELDLQSCRRYDDGDVASRPLFKRVEPAVFEKPTFKLLIALLDNYTAATGEAEVVSQAELNEDNAFLTVCDFRVPVLYEPYLLFHRPFVQQM
jgi:hypothetical protein